MAETNLHCTDSGLPKEANNSFMNSTFTVCSLIDQFVVSEKLCINKYVFGYCELGINVSDHIPLFMEMKIQPRNGTGHVLAHSQNGARTSSGARSL